MSIIIHNNRITHRETREAYLQEIKEKFCDYLHISEDDYHMLHYELAWAWYRHRNILGDEAMPYLISPGYHRWWNNMLALHEETLMRNYSGPHRREHYVRQVLNTNLRPGLMLNDRFRNEGEEILKEHPEMKKMEVR